MVFHGVRLSPGKVTGLAKVDGKPIFLVPGHIGSAVACILLFVIPAISGRLTGIVDPYVKVEAELAADIESRSGRHAFRTVSLEYREWGYAAVPVRKQLGGSPFMTLLTLADGFIVVKPGEELKEGDKVTVRLFPGPVRPGRLGGKSIY